METETEIPTTSGETEMRRRVPDSQESPVPSTSKSSEENDKQKNNTASASAKDSDDGDGESDAKAFECNICLDVAKDAVVSHCGHLFCWPCLHQWLETRPNRQSCPVCKAAISRDKVIPLYGRGGSNEDPRAKVPPRPTPNRQEQPEGNRFTWGNNEGGTGSFHLSFGIGAFPFGFFASAMNWGQPNPYAQPNGLANPQMEEQEFLSKVFLYVAVVFIIWLFLA